MHRFVYILVLVAIGKYMFRGTVLSNEMYKIIIFLTYFFVVLASVALADRSEYYWRCDPPCQTGGHVPTCCFNHGFYTGRCRGGRAICVSYWNRQHQWVWPYNDNELVLFSIWLPSISASLMISKFIMPLFLRCIIPFSFIYIRWFSISHLHVYHSHLFDIYVHFALKDSQFCALFFITVTKSRWKSLRVIYQRHCHSERHSHDSQPENPTISDVGNLHYRWNDKRVTWGSRSVERSLSTSTT